MFIKFNKHFCDKVYGHSRYYDGMLFGLIYNLTQLNPVCSMTMENMALEINVSRGLVKGALKRLVAEGLIQKSYRKHKDCNTYTKADWIKVNQVQLTQKGKDLMEKGNWLPVKQEWLTHLGLDKTTCVFMGEVLSSVLQQREQAEEEVVVHIQDYDWYKFGNALGMGMNSIHKAMSTMRKLGAISYKRYNRETFIHTDFFLSDLSEYADKLEYLCETPEELKDDTDRKRIVNLKDFLVSAMDRVKNAMSRKSNLEYAYKFHNQGDDFDREFYENADKTFKYGKSGWFNRKQLPWAILNWYRRRDYLYNLDWAGNLIHLLRLEDYYNYYREELPLAY